MRDSTKMHPVGSDEDQPFYPNQAIVEQIASHTAETPEPVGIELGSRPEVGELLASIRDAHESSFNESIQFE